jgi:hypothetical protein
MIELTNRESASVILVIVVVVALVTVPRLRPGHLRYHLANVLRAFFVWKIQLPLAIYFVYTAAIMGIASVLGIWNSTLLKETLLIIGGIGLPMFFSANRVSEGFKLVRDLVRDVLGVAAFMVAYVNIVLLPLWGELLLQSLLVLIATLVAVARLKPEHRIVERLGNGLLGIIGVYLIIYTTRQLSLNSAAVTLSDEAAKFALSVWLPVTLIPFIYVLAFIMHSEMILTMLPFFNGGRKPALRVQLACIWGLRFSTRLAIEFTGSWRRQIVQAASFRDACELMDEFREAVQERDRALAAYEARIQELTGIDGVGEAGLRLDRREFHATKKTLTELYSLEMGWHRNQGGIYRPELLEVLGSSLARVCPRSMASNSW